MIVTINEKFDLSPEWFEEQAKRNPSDAWQDRLCELLTIYRGHDEAEARQIADKLLTLGIDWEKVKAALE
jgi:hypothetical protein